MIAKETVQSIIGKGFADKLDEIIFDANGGFIYSRRQMVEMLGCANFIAAAKLAKVLRRLGINSPVKLYKMDPLSLARAKGIGETALFVAICILDESGYDILKWWGRRDNTVKFSSFKHHAIRRAKRRTQEVA